MVVLVLNSVWRQYLFGSIFIFFILIGIFFSSVFEYRISDWVTLKRLANKELVLTIAAVVTGSWLTTRLYHTLGWDSVAASAMIGLLGGILFPKFGAAIYCGSFVGMCSETLLAGPSEFFLSSFIAALLFISSKDHFEGIGGKLGTIAFVGALITGLSVNHQFPGALIPVFNPGWIIVLSAVMSAVATWWISTQTKLGPVISSAMIGLAGSFFLPQLVPDIGNLLSITVFCASFTGMSSKTRFPTFFPIALAGLFTGFLFLYSLSVLGGAGGKLGTISFASLLCVLGYKNLILQLRKRKIQEYSEET